ncbi:hypothetical protein DFA_07458 [Cavenderia fasciculata]|uniref:Fatty acid hydroxylase domain-containing protein n=1 Tax=Cavenderia fasciculata TaxID=261658 RepID=F4PWH0_CACFS|nr:uncharacterized protein DFA_07458 [Cavenderia fasciculata]EGG20334.1 hypothetical protein DFA_07458 [Cavenderia fasciculata]|eukprot:XP_004367317.1 hypothetical protein DFA_07458 [Cavenderia fasciculata]
MDDATFIGYIHFIRYINVRTTPKIRLLVEIFCLFVIAIFSAALLLLHTQYVGKADCILEVFNSNFPKYKFDILSIHIKEEDLAYSHLRDIVLSGSSQTTGSSGSSDLDGTEEDGGDREKKDYHWDPVSGTTIGGKRVPGGGGSGSSKIGDNYPFSQPIEDRHHHLKRPNPNLYESLQSKKRVVATQEENMELLNLFLYETQQKYEFSLQKGFLLLSPDIRTMYNITTFQINIFTNQTCLGGPYHKMLIKLLGYDIVIINNLVNSFKGNGYLKIFDDNSLINLSQYSSPEREFSYEYIIYLIQCIVKVNLIFFSTIIVFGIGRIGVFFLSRFFDASPRGFHVLMIHNCIIGLIFVIVQIGNIYLFSYFLLPEYLVFLICSLFSSYVSTWGLRSKESIKYYPIMFLGILYLLGHYVMIFPSGFHMISFCLSYTTTEYLLVLCILNFELPAVMNNRIPSPYNYMDVDINQIINNNNLYSEEEEEEEEEEEDDEQEEDEQQEYDEGQQQQQQQQQEQQMESILENFVEVTLVPSAVCVFVFFATCITFDLIAANKTLRKKFMIQQVTETPEKIKEMISVAMRNLFVGMIILFLLHPLHKLIITVGDYDVLKELGVLVVMLFLADADFYWSHRLLHHKYFYASCHKLHHSCKHPVPWTSLYVDWGEFFIAILSSFLVPLWTAPLLGLHPHYYTYSLYLLVITFSLVMSHDGMELPFLSATHHDEHHLLFTGNYGSRIGLWDVLCSTTIKSKKSN